MAKSDVPLLFPTNTGDSPARLGTIPDAFRTVAAHYPDRIALRERNRSITYAEFDEASNRVANRLLELGTTHRPLVIVAPLEVNSVVVLYGALKVGQLAVPLDPRWPQEKWREVVRRTDGILVVPDAATRDAVAGAGEAPLVAADLFGDRTDDPRVELDPRAPAFVFFTSGSTGAPKGTVVGHEMAVRALDMFDVTPDMRVALLAPLGFISGAVAAIAVLLTGSRGCFFDLAGGDLHGLLDWIDEEQITIMGLTVTVIGLMATMAIDEGRTLDSLDFVGHGGEAGTVQHFERARRAFPHATFRHSYGMTETGSVAGYDVGSTVETSETSVPVGHPWPWVDVEIVDEGGEPVAAGEPGEIVVTGAQVALAYWDEPLLTQERFVEHPDGTRSVRTGDRGRLRADGMLEHLGRLDRRVKVHGQFVDLTAVEHELERIDVVRQAVVSAVPTEDGYRVVAHVVLPKDSLVTTGALRRDLSVRLPSYMIPRAFFRLDNIPQTANGKVDRVWLRDTAMGALPLESEYVEPRDALEREVAALFAEVLAVESVGAFDDFFELGGDSLSAIELLAGIEERYDIELNPNELLLEPTVSGVAGRLGDGAAPASRHDVLVPLRPGDGRPLCGVPGAAATPLQLRPLARRLERTAFEAFVFRGLEERALPDYTIGAIARRNVRALRRRHDGPYRLFGFSFGATVALAMAHELERAGGTVELLALLEPSLGRLSIPEELVESFTEKVRDRATTGHEGRGIRARAEQGVALARVGARYTRRQLRLATTGIVARRGEAQRDVFLPHQQRMLRYHEPMPYSGPTLLFGSERYFTRVGSTLDALFPPEASGGNRRDVLVTGDHRDLVREPNVAEVARVLDGWFAERDRECAQTWQAEQ